MAAYFSSRKRLLTGMGRTYAFVPRHRLSGLGQSTDIDIVTGLPCDDPRANCGTLEPTTMIAAPTTLGPPPGFFTPPAPIVPAPGAAAAPPLPFPAFGPVPAPIIVFPSGGSAAAAKVTAPAASWMDQEMIAGVPNKYVAIGVAALVLMMGMSKGRR